MNDTNNSIEEIAIIGMSGRFPGAQNISQFWQNLANGVESISRFSDEELIAQGVTEEKIKDPDYVKAGTILQDADMFDAAFFGYNKRDAEIMDPQQRIFLEIAWEALESAGYNPDSYDGAIGVFAGTSGNDYRKYIAANQLSITSGLDSLELMVGNDADFLTTRVSYKLNLKGPSLTIQTACSTSLVAVQQACQSLLTYQSDMALAGGVCIRFPQGQGYIYQEGMIWSPDGHCRPFDAQGEGTLFGHGAGIVVLKRLSEALQDGDTIMAVIKGSAINNDGSMKVGFTAPSVDGQAEAISTALALGNVAADTVSYIETHGTGTPLGDPIEIEALTQSFRAHTTRIGYCAIGSVKSNIGHLDVAAGIAGLIKTVLALQHKKIPPSLHFTSPNPNIDFANSPFYVNNTLKEWQSDGQPRRAGVSSFGIGGTNAHVVLEEAPAAMIKESSKSWHLLPLSAKGETALQAMTTNLVEYLDKNPHLPLEDTAHTLQQGRKHFSQRRVAVCSSLEDAAHVLSFKEPDRIFTSVSTVFKRDIIFMFSGQGSQHVNMSRDLYQEYPFFKKQIDLCSQILQPHLGLDLRDILYPPEDKIKEATQDITQTFITQPSLFTIEYSLARLWNHLGIFPSALVGHSIGEYTAACIAGVFSLEDALQLVAARGRLMQSLPPGSMLAIPLSKDEVQPYLSPEVSLAVLNSASMSVVSGETDRIDYLANLLLEKGIEGRILHTSHAFHSPMMEPILEDFEIEVAKTKRNAPKIPFVSNLTGTWITDSQAQDPSFWSKHLRRTVQFFACAGELLTNYPQGVLMEVGPGQTLSLLTKQHPSSTQDHSILASARRPVERKNDVQYFLNTLGQLWLNGCQIEWSKLYEDEKRRRMPLPTYPFERERYWIEAVPHVSMAKSEEQALKRRQRIEPDVPNLPFEKDSGSNQERLIFTLKKDLEDASGKDFGNVDESLTFLELGFDSLFLIQWCNGLKKKFKIQLSVHQLLDELSTFNNLADYIGSQISPEISPSPVLVQEPVMETTSPSPVASPSKKDEVELSSPLSGHQPEAEIVERLVSDQLRIMSQQLEMLRAAGSSTTLQELFDALEVLPVSTTEQRHVESTPSVPGGVQQSEKGAFGGAIRPVPHDIMLPLSSGQQRLWYLDQLMPNSPVYNLPEVFRLKGRLDKGVVERALNEIVRRHEILRTAYKLRDGIPAQIIATSFHIEVPVIDFRDRTAAAREAAVAEFLEAEGARPFDLSESPLFRVTILRLADDEYILFFMPHHSVFDGWSFSIFQRELIALYEAYISEKPSPLPELPIQYADFAYWQQESLKGKDIENQLAYWHEQLKGELPLLEIPTDYPRPAEQSGRGAREKLHLGQQFIETLTALGHSERATLFMVLLTAFKTLLYRYTGQEDLIVGSPIAGRVRPETEDLIGFFVNTLVFRTGLNQELSFRELLQRVRQVCLEAFRHQDVPFELLVEVLQPERDLSRTPLFQAQFVFEPSLMELETKMNGVSWLREKVTTRVAQTDLSIWISVAKNGLDAELEYSTDLFHQSTIVHLLGHYEVLLHAIVANPDCKISELVLLPESELRRLLVDWNSTAVNYHEASTIHELIEKQVAQTPDRVAATFEEKSLSFHALNSLANQLAHHLKALGVGPDVLVGMCMERSLDMLVGVLGILKAGGAYVPLDPDYPQDRLAYMVDDAKITVLLTQKTLEAGLPKCGAQKICMDNEWEAISKLSDENLLHKEGAERSGPENLAYVIYTSGSTGKPKGVKVPHGAAVNFLLSMAQKPGFTEEDVLLGVTTLSFDIHVLELYLPLVVGGKVCVVSREVASDGLQLLEALKKTEATVMQATPTTWRLLLAAGWEGSKKLKVLCGGEAFPSDLARELIKHAGSVWNMYGPTETTVWSTVYQLKDPEGKILIGQPIANTSVYILDKHLQQVPVGVPGELHIGGDGVTLGYWNRPELTSERFIPDHFTKESGARLYKTGDLVKWRPEGNLEYLNRLDNQVKVRGFRIELGEIETALAKHEALRQSAIIVKEVRPGDSRLVAYYVVSPGQNVTSTELRKHLREGLPEYMIPQHFVEVDKLLLTPAGKIDRKGLAAFFKLGGGGEEEFIPPQTEAEKFLAVIWKESLGVERVSAHDNFFDIGGHSLLCMQVIERIRKETGIRLSLRVILLNTLRQIAAEYPFVFLEEEETDMERAQDNKSEASTESIFKRLTSKLMRVAK